MPQRGYSGDICKQKLARLREMRTPKLRPDAEGRLQQVHHGKICRCLLINHIAYYTRFCVWGKASRPLEGIQRARDI